MAKRKRSIYYVSKQEFMESIIEAQNLEIVTERLGLVYLKLVTNLQRKSNWHNYPKQVKDEMQSNALCDLVASYNKFNINKSDNPFAYFTTIANNSFKKTINKEKNQMSFITFLTQMSQFSNPEMYRKYMNNEGVKRWTKDIKNDTK